MLSTTQIQDGIKANGLKDELYVELPNGEILELCAVTVIDGKTVLRPEVKL